MKFITPALAFALLVLIGSPSMADLLVNGDFEKDPILGAGQSGLNPGDAKGIETDPNEGAYANFRISGVQDWETPFVGDGATGVGSGLAKLNNLIPGGYGAEDQSLLLNTWNSIVFQQIDSTVLNPGWKLTANVKFASWELNGSRAGFMGLFSDAGGGYVARAELGNDDWTNSPLDFLVGDREFGNASLEYTVNANDVGNPVYLVFGLYTPSTGSIIFDDASLVQSVPEPTGCLLLSCLGVVMLRRKRA